jgi:membrane-bound metal-dependent hydrolase YbcI (DUF457 family)
MLPLAHIGFAMLLSSILYLPLAASVFGALIPDIIDKAFFALGFGLCGRFIAHTVFFGPLIALTAFAATKRKDVALAVLLGSYLHLLMDVKTFVPWFYPVVNYNFSCPPTVIKPDLIDMAFEFAGALLIPITLALKPRLKDISQVVRKRKPSS